MVEWDEEISENESSLVSDRRPWCAYSYRVGGGPIYACAKGGLVEIINQQEKKIKKNLTLTKVRQLG